MELLWKKIIRCDWANKSELEQKYHDEEWAVPVHDDKKVEKLLNNEGIIRNKLKINAVITNAKEYFRLCEEFGSLDKYLWAYVDNKPIKNSWAKIEEVPARTELSDKISKDLKKRGFKFVGSTIIYAFMQAVGMVNDHLVTCSFYNKAEEKKWKKEKHI